MRTRPYLWVFLATAFVSTGVAAQDQGPAISSVRAKATISGCNDGTPISGRAILSERPSGEGVKLVDIAMFVNGLPPGKHAVHIHAVGSCTATTIPCGGAGGHFDPGPNSNPAPDGNHPFHSGDLINLVVNSRGFGALYTTTSRVTLSGGPLSILDADGSAFIIHVNPDTYCPDGVVMGCAGGARAACGVITLDN
jgi:Cu-Zn family superoxide dismutase